MATAISTETRSASVDRRSDHAHETAARQGYFDVDVDGRGNDRFHIGFSRIEPDNCKALVPEGRRMTWTYAELGIPRNATVLITNPVGR